MKLDKYLSDHHVSFERLEHPEVFTANRVAQALHVPGREVAKAVLLRSRSGYALAVLPATHRVDLEQAGRDLGAERVELADEDEVSRLFPDCERGAVPPFGSLYELPTLVDASLTHDEQIVFEAQNHHEAIRMKYQDYEALEHPRRGHFATQEWTSD